MSDYSLQRFNMVETQVRTNDVTDTRIHAAMNAIERERFVPTAKRAIAYADVPIEVAQGRFLPDPRTFAKLLQLAGVGAADSVLDVACATGYSTAVIAQLAKRITALEQDADLVRIATELVRASGVTNATVVQGGLTEGCKQRAPFDVIFINGATETIPQTLFGQLAEGGRLVAVRHGSPGRAQLYVREKGRVGCRDDFDSATPLLAGFRKTVGFVF
jgi:protein-L-isoaspartate(D-aspartate) O-methyltransferase